MLLFGVTLRLIGELPQLDTYIWLLIGGTFTLIWWLSNICWFSCYLHDIWVTHFCKSQTTLTILHNEECFSLSYDMLDFCAWGGHIRRRRVIVRRQPTCIVNHLWWNNSTTLILWKNSWPSTNYAALAMAKNYQSCHAPKPWPQMRHIRCNLFSIKQQNQ